MIDDASASPKIAPPVSSDRAGAKTSQQRLELIIGSNIFRSTNGIVTIQGKAQLVIERQPEQELLLTMDLYDHHGVQTAHLRRNVFMLNRSEQFAIETHRPQCDGPGDDSWVRLTDRRSGSPVIEIHLVSAHRVHIVSGKFHSHRGVPVDITPNFCRIGPSTTLFGEIRESRGGMVNLGAEPSPSFPTQP